jgi:hypothetical protein
MNYNICDNHGQYFGKLCQICYLETENKRLREALEILAAENSGTCCECSDVKDIARAALEGE